MPLPTALDRNGKNIYVGDIIRIIKLSQDFINNFPEKDRTSIESMAGAFFKICKIDEAGKPWVNREWEDEAGRFQSDIVALDAVEMERI